MKKLSAVRLRSVITSLSHLKMTTNLLADMFAVVESRNYKPEEILIPTKLLKTMRKRARKNFGVIENEIWGAKLTPILDDALIINARREGKGPVRRFAF